MKKYIPQLFVFLAVGYLLFLIRPAILGQLSGTFQPHQVPQEYVQLEQFLNKQQQFSRILWVPVSQRFGFYSYQHPAVSAEDFFHVASVSGVIDFLQKSSTESLLQQAAVQYVVVPYDSEKEIFIQDRKYNNALYNKTKQKINAIPWLTKVSGFGNIAVFQVPDPKDHFYLLGKGSISYTFVNPTQYRVRLHNVAKGEKFVFSESYNSYWVAKLDGKTQVGSGVFHDKFNSFVLPKSGTYTLTIFYQPQSWVDIGLWISGITVLGVLACLVWFSKVNMLK